MSETRIIVVAPTGRDGKLICQLLERLGFEVQLCPDCKTACLEAEKGVGALILADEVFNTETLSTLGSFIAAQSSWSDLPVIVLTGGGRTTAGSEARRKVREPLGNVIVIERPVRPETLASTVKSAVRARLRQYEVRDHLQQERIAADALRKSEKLAVAGRLAATIAHEINNPLESVLNLHYLMASAETLEDSKKILQLADSELQRVIEITTHTLKFHRENTIAKDTDLAAVLDSVLKLYDRRLKTSGVNVNCEVEGPSNIIGFGGELRQLLANLISNALDAMPTGGSLRIRIAPSAQRSNGAGRGVRVVVADTGAGIPLEVRNRVLEPFVSTKQDTGTGLGLWVSSEIVRKHGGEMRFKSRVGKGTVFSLLLRGSSKAA